MRIENLAFLSRKNGLSPGQNGLFRDKKIKSGTKRLSPGPKGLFRLFFPGKVRDKKVKSGTKRLSPGQRG